MRCMIDTNGYRGYREKPKGAEVARCRNQMKITACDAESFIHGISRGYAWMPGVMRGGQRRENWQNQQLIALDFDNKRVVLDADGKPLRDQNNRVVQRDLVPGEEGYIGPDEAIRRARLSGVAPMAMYFTYSSTSAHPKFRVVIMLEEPCEDPDVMELAIDNLLYLFPEADQSCKDLARLFFGAKDKSSVTSFVDSEWDATDIRAILALPPRPVEGLCRGPVKKRCRPRTVRREQGEVDLAALKESADLLGMIQADTGESGHKIGRRVEFHNCPICGHRDCFRYYAHNNSWTCFSASNATGRRGGSVIDYVMARDGVDVGAAIALLAGETEVGSD